MFKRGMWSVYRVCDLYIDALLLGEGVAYGGLPFPGTGCPIPGIG